MVKKFFSLVFFLTIMVGLVIGASGGTSGFEEAQNYIVGLIGRLVRFLFSILIILSTILLIYLGILYIVMGKTEAKVMDKSIDLRKSLFYLIIGLVLLILSFFLPNIIKDFIQTSTQ